MKKALIVLTVCLLQTTDLSAQLQTKILGGISICNFSKIPFGTTDFKAGLQFGGLLMFGSRNYLETGAWYSEKAIDYIIDDGTTSITNEFKFTGIRVPVSVGFRLLGDKDAQFNLRIFGGGSGFFLLSVSDNLNTSDFVSPSWALHTGAGIDIWLVTLDVTYEWSMSNIQKDNSVLDFGKFRTIYVTAGFRLTL